MTNVLQFGTPGGGGGGGGGFLSGILGTLGYPLLLIAAAIILALSIFIGRWLGGKAEDVSARVALGEAVQETPLGALFGSARRVDEVVGLGVRYLVVLAGVTMAASTANFNNLTDFLIRLVRYAPSMLGAVVIVLVGFVVAGYVARATKEHPVFGGHSLTPLIATVAKVVIYFVVVAVALDGLGYSTVILNTIAQGVAIGLGLGLALALGIGIGMGSQDYVADHVEDWLGR